MQEERLFFGESSCPGREEELVLAGATLGCPAQAPLFPDASTGGSLAHGTSGSPAPEGHPEKGLCKP